MGGHHNQESDNRHEKMQETKSGLDDTVGIKTDVSRREQELEQVKEMKRSRAWFVLTKAGAMVGEVPETRCETKV